MKMETIKLTDDQIEFIERGCSEVWPIERQFLRWSLKRNIRHGTALVSRGVEADGVESVAHLIVTGPWILLAAIFDCSEPQSSRFLREHPIEYLVISVSSYSR